MDKLVQQQQLHIQQLEKFRQNFKKDSKSRKTIIYCEKFLTKLEELNSKFVEKHENILNLLTGSAAELDHEYFKEELCDKFEETHFDLVIELESLLLESKAPTEDNSGVQSKNNNLNNTNVDNDEVNLPRISVPKFNGKYEDWISFRDLFQSLIHNKKGVANVQKMHYLKCCVIGEAENLLKHLTVSDTNYEIAWTILTDRYNNKQALLNSQFRKLFSLHTANETSSSLKSLVDQTLEVKQSIEAMGFENLWQLALVHLTAQRLPRESRQLWEQEVCSKSELPSFEEMKTFIENRFRALEAVGTERIKPKVSSFTRNTYTAQANNYISCSLCKGSHVLRQCNQFQSLDHAAKLALVKQKGLCLNCLRSGHIATNCPSTGRCLKCNGSHHTLLHRHDARLRTPNANQLSVNHSNILSTKHVLLATAMVLVPSRNGDILLRALIDPGSQATLISESAVQLLGINRNRSNIRISGIQSNTSTRVNGVVSVTIKTIDNESIFFEACILQKLTNDIPSRIVPFNVKEQTIGLRLADPNFDKPGKIDLLLGADMYGKIIIGDTFKLPSGPVALNTRIGWIITGETNVATSELRSYKIEVENQDNDLNSLLRRFWELEEVQLSTTFLTEDESICERHFVENTVREVDGRFKVRLPFKSFEFKNSIGDSRRIAEASFVALERKFSRDPELKQEYVKCIDDYIASGHMRLVDNNTSTIAKCNYLPHHAVCKDSTTTKVRVVFDASRKTSTGVSLNDTLLTGLALQNNLNSVLLRFRLHRYAFVADITKMFRQIRIHEEDSQFQRILWRSHPTKPIQDYRLTTVTFGTTSAPFLAIRTLHLLADKEKHRFPIGAQSIYTDFYVDDCLSGENDIHQALEKIKQITSLLASGGFILRKWLSNELSLLEGIDPSDIEMNNSLQFNLDQGFKSLGIEWHPLLDYFTYRLNLRPRNARYTKRTMLSDVASLYDPLGWISPILITAKILLKSLWRDGNSWDEALPHNIEKDWLKLRNSLNEIENIKVPRWLCTDGTSKKLELHGFGDASKEAYGAVIYLVVRDNNSVQTRLIMSKSKVSPIKEVAIARLELCAAQLLAKLMKVVWDAYNYSQVETWLWSDNTTVLCWLKGHPTKWKVFVANRTTDIVNTVGNTPWRYIPSNENPADLTSRGAKPKDLIDNTLWWNGPSWLLHEKHHWPNSEQIGNTDEELRETTPLQCYTVRFCDLDQLLSRFSSFTTLIRVTAFCFRFIQSALKIRADSEYLTTEEIARSLEFWVKYVQERSFPLEIRNIKMKIPVDKKSKIRNLNPSLDKNGILRVGGRLRNSQLSLDEIHPIIIPKHGRFTELLVEKIHKDTLHGQTQLMLATLRKKFWVIDGRNVIRHLIHKCMACFRTKAATSSQLMGDLPSPRVTISRPFTHTGVDYCGPFSLRDHTGRGNKTHKAYVAVFVCLAVKAIHIELVNDMSTAAFLAALRRFIGRRGLCSHIYSDCGTNFVGAEKELRHIAKINLSIRNQLSSEGISWHFNPPASPHFGGLWEAGVKSIKSHLKRIMGNTCLTYEEFNTTLIDVEACLNSRPLCPLTDDPTDEVSLTPGHFLIGDSLLAPPQNNVLDIKFDFLETLVK